MQSSSCVVSRGWISVTPTFAASARAGSCFEQRASSSIASILRSRTTRGLAVSTVSGPRIGNVQEGTTRFFPRPSSTSTTQIRQAA